MFWKVSCEEAGAHDAARAADSGSAGRFVLQRHRDEWGEHLDLRLEQDGYLCGWRIDGDRLEEAWASEKGPHPLRWLEGDAPALREDEGSYAWLECDDRQRRVLLKGRAGARVVCVERADEFTPRLACSVARALRASGATVAQLERLALDGVAARQRAAGRLCGLGRELDGAAFDEAVARRMLEGLSLDEIHAQLRAYEVRFDAKYPPQPVSQGERLAEAEGARNETALAILQG